ncbi:hypothetical protein [Reyranella sp.]|uniref:hypothetical protein n=1 Tax=Reyranella sp. TaxID=1929291 RepID=UPI003D10E347
MESAYFKALAPPQFVVCDDVRSEIGGKDVLAGVYPGNVIVVGRLPARIEFATWTVFRAGKGGTFDCQYRFKMEDGVATGLGRTTFSDMTVDKLTALRTKSQIDVSEPQVVEMQLRFEGEGWISARALEIVRQT